MTASKDYKEVAEEAILDYFRTHNAEPFHSDDLWHVIPDEHRGVISLAVMAMVNKKLIVGCGYRKSAIPSRKGSPSQEYRLTELGRDRLAGMGAGWTGAGAHSGETSSVGSNGHVRQQPAGEPRPIALPGMEGINPPSAYDPYSEAA